jgi:arginyl-tRNA synthetase
VSANRQSLIQYVRSVLHEAFQTEPKLADLYEDSSQLMINRSKPEFGDYQCNQAMPWAKSLKMNPREIAGLMTAALERTFTQAGQAPFTTEIAGPGFINIKLTDQCLLEQFEHIRPADHGIAQTSDKQLVVVDYSSPNIAKEMHVGHLRSTIIGESVARILDYTGHTVERVNHLGDWGTQFGMLIRFLKEEHGYPEQKDFEIGDLVAFYKQAKARFDEDEDFRERARKEVTLLQSGDTDNIEAWKLLCEISRRSFSEIYKTLDVDLIERGESFYNPWLADVVSEMDKNGLMETSDGAACIFSQKLKNRDGDALPLIIRKSDGGYTYDTTDLAALRYRLFEQGAGRVVYVTDKGQSTHFQQIFEAADLAGWMKERPARLDHVGFGLVLGEDKKKFRTRSGETVRLVDLLQEAVKRAEAIAREKNENAEQAFDEQTIEHISRTIGTAAVKYADLSQNRESDYVFSFDRMLQLNGNTAPYLIYVYVRVAGIFRKDQAQPATDEVQLSEPAERALLLHLLCYRELIGGLVDDFATQHLADYLFELSSLFNRFYHECPVLHAEEPLRSSRLNLARKTADILKDGLYLLGIDVLEKM